MPQTTVTDPITGQEVPFAHLVLGRDQILARLWALANLSPETTRNNIAGQIKALSMIVAIEGLIPDRRLAPSGNQPAVPPISPNIDRSKWLREQQAQAEGTLPGETSTPAEAPCVAPPAPTQPTPPRPAPTVPNHLGLANPFVHPEKTNWVPDATGPIFDAMPYAGGSLKLPFSPQRGFSRGVRGTR